MNLLTEYVFEYKKEEKIPKDIGTFVDFIRIRYEGDWVLLTSTGDIIVDKSLKKVLESYGEKKDAKIVLLIKAPSKSGAMFR